MEHKSNQGVQNRNPNEVEIKKEDFEALTVDVCGLPKFFKTILFDKIDTAKTGKITKA